MWLPNTIQDLMQKVCVAFLGKCGVCSGVLGAQDEAAVGTIGPPPDPSATCKSFYNLPMRRAPRALVPPCFDLQFNS